MSNYNDLLDLLQDDEDFAEIELPEIISQHNPSADLAQPFDISLFANEIYESSANKNQVYHKLAQNINAYDIAHNCIRQIIYKLSNSPVEIFADRWLPLLMRSMIGTAIHEFIQTSKQFTETERSLKVPSIRFSGRLDALIGRNVLVEIKSCTYDDYSKILKHRRPRDPDFYQSIAYKYILENHLAEAKNPGVETRSPPPSLDKYEIDTFQFIYIAHDIIAADFDNFGEMLQAIKNLKKALNSKANKFFFMTSVVLETKNFDVTPYLAYVKNKIDTINYYLTTNKMPGDECEFVNKKGCFFCLYSPYCPIRK